MQSGKGNSKDWILEFETLDNNISPLMGWESSRDTMSEIKLNLEYVRSTRNLYLY